MNTEDQRKITLQIQFAYLRQVYQLLYQYSLLNSFLFLAASEKSTSGSEKINQEEHPEKPVRKPTPHQGKRINSTILASGATYDSFTGRFLKEDPLQGDLHTPPSAHRYKYGFDNPTAYIDPTGEGNDTPHYYDALLIAKLVGLTESEAYVYALGAQVGDEFAHHDAVNNSIGFMYQLGKTFSLDKIEKKGANTLLNNCGTHSLCGTDPKIVRDSVKEYILEYAQNYLEIGTADHTFTDSFFHIQKNTLYELFNQKLHVPLIGHLFELTSTDKSYLYFGSKRIKAFKERARLLYEYSVKNGTQTLNKDEFSSNLDTMVNALINQQIQLEKPHRQVRGGATVYIDTDLEKIKDQDEFDLMIKLLEEHGFENIPKTQNHEPHKNIFKLLNKFSEDQLLGMALVVNPKDGLKMKELSKEELILFLNYQFDKAAFQSRDNVFSGVIKRMAGVETVSESKNKPGAKELSK